MLQLDWPSQPFFSSCSWEPSREKSRFFHYFFLSRDRGNKKIIEINDVTYDVTHGQKAKILWVQRKCTQLIYKLYHFIENFKRNATLLRAFPYSIRIKSYGRSKFWTSMPGCTIEGSGVFVYLDDILIASKSFDEHLRQLREVFERLRSAGLRLKPKKCLFLRDEVPYLGHVVCAEGIKLDPTKTEKVKSFPVPCDVTGVRQFIGLASYYRRFVANFACIASPLHALTKKNAKFEWTTECQTAFDKLNERLRSAGLRLKPKKCLFLRDEVPYLGHVVCAEGIKLDPTKTEKVKSFPVPCDVTGVRQFIGLASYYRRFVANFACIASPLHALTKKNAKFEWTTECQTAFDKLKELLVSAPVLAYPRFGLGVEFTLETDASGVGLGAVLSQTQDDGQLHPIAYASRSLDSSERNYGITELETLAVVWAARYFRQYSGASYDRFY